MTSLQPLEKIALGKLTTLPLVVIVPAPVNVMTCPEASHAPMSQFSAQLTTVPACRLEQSQVVPALVVTYEKGFVQLEAFQLLLVSLANTHHWTVVPTLEVIVFVTFDQFVIPDIEAQESAYKLFDSEKYISEIFTQSELSWAALNITVPF